MKLSVHSKTNVTPLTVVCVLTNHLQLSNTFRFVRTQTEVD